MINQFSIAGRQIGMDSSPYIIAEMSANHNGAIENAFAIIDMAKRCGADAVKMQTYTPDTITINSTKKDFQINDGLWAGRTLHQLYDCAHTPWSWHRDLFDYAKSKCITIFSTPFDFTAVDLLEELDAPAYKIASFECIDLPLIRRVASTGKPMIISTGMANENEIEEAVDTALSNGSGALTLLHCISSYPASAKDYNLKTISDMRTRYDVNVGLSDHTLDNTTAIASVALGAVIVEKHVTLNKNGGGPDDSFSLDEKELKQLCNDTKKAWQALGRVNYELTEGEIGNIKFRRSLYFVRKMKAGAIIRDNDIRSIRPGYGLSPKYFDALIGTKVLHDVDACTPVTAEVVDLPAD
ncbi:pseudaminic acid synthase [Amylibacter sp.]|nr:pseudaminic acid synthase [Amylibacter sp.]